MRIIILALAVVAGASGVRLSSPGLDALDEKVFRAANPPPTGTIPLPGTPGSHMNPDGLMWTGSNHMYEGKAGAHAVPYMVHEVWHKGVDYSANNAKRWSTKDGMAPTLVGHVDDGISMAGVFGIGAQDPSDKFGFPDQMPIPNKWNPVPPYHPADFDVEGPTPTGTTAGLLSRTGMDKQTNPDHLYGPGPVRTVVNHEFRGGVPNGPIEGAKQHFVAEAFAAADARDRAIVAATANGAAPSAASTEDETDGGFGSTTGSESAAGSSSDSGNASGNAGGSPSGSPSEGSATESSESEGGESEGSSDGSATE